METHPEAAPASPEGSRDERYVSVAHHGKLVVVVLNEWLWDLVRCAIHRSAALETLHNLVDEAEASSQVRATGMYPKGREVASDSPDADDDEDEEWPDLAVIAEENRRNVGASNP